MLPSSTGTWSRNTRSPANSVLARLIEHRQIVVAVPGRPGPQGEPAAEIERHSVLDEQCRRHDLDVVDQFGAHDAAESVEIKRPAARERLRQIAVADKAGSVRNEGRIAEHMVGMAMGVDDVADRLAGAGADRGQQRLPSRKLPPVSITATASSPTMKPTLAMSPSFSRVISAMVPECKKIPGATSLTGNSAVPARASVMSPSRDKAAITRAMRDTFPPQFKGLRRIALQQGKAGIKSGETWCVHALHG